MQHCLVWRRSTDVFRLMHWKLCKFAWAHNCPVDLCLDWKTILDARHPSTMHSTTRVTWPGVVVAYLHSNMHPLSEMWTLLSLRDPLGWWGCTKERQVPIHLLLKRNLFECRSRFWLHNDIITMKEACWPINLCCANYGGWLLLYSSDPLTELTEHGQIAHIFGNEWELSFCIDWGCLRNALYPHDIYIANQRLYSPRPVPSSAVMPCQ